MSRSSRETPTEAARWAGRSLVAFGSVILGAWLALFLLRGWLTLDLAALTAIGLGWAVGSGSRRARRGAMALMGAYAILCPLAAGALALEAGGLLPFRLPALPLDPPAALGALAMVFAWSLVNLRLLVRAQERAA